MHMVRCEGKRVSAWQVRTGQRGPGQTRAFGDKEYGSTEAARAAAEAFMEQVRPAAPPPRRARSDTRGIVPVRVSRANGGTCLTLEVAVGTKRTSVSLQKWGVGPGIVRAIEIRGLEGEEAERVAEILLRKCGRGT